VLSGVGRAPGEQQVIFASSTRTFRDPENFASQWRKAREELGVPDVTSHSFRKTGADLIDDEDLSASVPTIWATRRCP
jgi:integrase